MKKLSHKLLALAAVALSTSAFAGRALPVLTCEGTDQFGGPIEARIFYQPSSSPRAEVLGFLVSNSDDPSERFYCFGGCVKFQRGVDAEQIVISLAEPGAHGATMGFDFDGSILTGGQGVFSEAIGHLTKPDGSTRFVSSTLSCTGGEGIAKLVALGVTPRR